MAIVVAGGTGFLGSALVQALVADGRDVVVLTRDGRTGLRSSPQLQQWTPDGTAVYFSSEKNNAGQLAIDQVNVATKVRTRLAAIQGKSMVTPKMSENAEKMSPTSWNPPPKPPDGPAWPKRS